MKRRTFIKSAAVAAAASPLMLKGIPLQAGTPLPVLAQLPQDNDKILLIIQLFGGNDGLNTVIPAEDDAYYKLRPRIAVQKKDALNKLGNTYLHPALGKGSRGGMAQMLELGTLSIVQGVGYDNPNLSHFRSTDIWLSGINSSDPNVRLETGWVGRYLEKRYPDFPASLPDHPLAIQFGGFSLALLSSKGRMGIEVTDPSGQKGVGSEVDALDPDSPNTAYATEYAFIADIASRSNKYAQAVKDAYAAGLPKLKGDYKQSGFAGQMASVGALIAGGLKTKVYVLSMGGFDTHVTQQFDDNTGSHPSLLTALGDGVSQFMYDMTRLGLADRVVGITVSEFGRRPHENGSFGTDHGAASVQFVFGTQVNSGVFGNAYDLKNLNSNGDLFYQIDYRTVYAEILTDWFGLTQQETREVLQKDDLDPLNVLKSQVSGADSGATARGGFAITGNYPNPFTTATTLELSLDRTSDVVVEITSVSGRRMMRVLDRRLDAGVHRIPINADLPTGTYICTMRTGGRSATHIMQCVR
ncbi:MAG: 5-nucleotidase [Chlorobi bacterium]|nr:5-nucleotidase [Chlorobiota bacterium]